MTVIKVVRTPYATATKETRVYKVQYTTVTKETHLCYKKISKRKTTDKQDLNMQYWKSKVQLKQITHNIRHSKTWLESLKK